MSLPKPYYEEPGITIYCADCRDVLPHLPPVDLVLTDPPYGIGKAEWDDSFPTEWLSLIPDSTRILVAAGAGEMIKIANHLGSRYRDCIVMHARNGMTRGPTGFGNWFPVLVAGDWKWDYRPNHLSFNVSLTESIPHPSPKPLEAIKRLMKYYSEPEWLTADPFMGSGTTLRAAKDLGLSAIGIEIEEKYCAIAVERLRQEVLPLSGMETTNADRD